MLIKDKLSRISLNSLIPSKKIPAPVVFTEEPLSSSPFVMPQNRKIDAPFTGRVKELDLLRSLYRELKSFRTNIGSSKNDLEKTLVIGIKGEAGIGKSRLVAEFQKNIAASYHGKNFIYRAGCVSSGQEAYGLFRGFFSISNFLKQAVTAERRTLIKNTISENILSLAREAGKNDLPLVIMLEDMQWADELSLAALDHFVSAVNLAAGEEDLMLFLLLNYRPSYRPGRVLRKECRLVEIELKGFSESESKQFISKLTGSKKITTNAVEQISRRSEGNPFNLEEICRSLDDGSKHIKIPATVKGLLVDKVSQLEKDERAVLIISSVLGRKFTLKLLNGILKKAGKPPAGADVLSRLEEKQYLVNLTSDIYEFRHDLLQEIVYRQLNKELRKNVHALAAGAIEEVYSANLSAHYYELTRHYEASGDEANTIKYLEKAGDKARDNYENERAINYYKKLANNNHDNELLILYKLIELLKLTGKLKNALSYSDKIVELSVKPEDTINSHTIRSEIYYLLRNYEFALASNRKALRKSKRYSGDDFYCKIFANMGKIYMKLSKYNKAEFYYKKQLKWSNLKDNKLYEAKALDNLGMLKRLKGSYKSALLYYKESEAKYKNLNDIISLGHIQDKIGTIYYYLGEYENSLKYYNNAIKMNKATGSILGISNTTGNMATLYTTIGNNSKARFYLKNRLKMCTVINDMQGIANTFQSFGNIFFKEYNYQGAISYYTKSLRIYENLKMKKNIANIYSNLGITFQCLGEYERANTYLDLQIKIDKNVGNMEGLSRGYINKANSKSYQGFHSEAIPLYNKSIKIAQKISNKKLLANAILNCAESNFEIKRFKLVSKLLLVAWKICALEKFEEEIFKCKLLMLKAEIYYTYYHVNKATEHLLALTDRLKDLANISPNIEQLGVVYFEYARIMYLLNEKTITTEIRRFMQKSKEILETTASLTFDTEFILRRVS